MVLESKGFQCEICWKVYDSWHKAKDCEYNHKRDRMDNIKWITKDDSKIKVRYDTGERID